MPRALRHSDATLLRRLLVGAACATLPTAATALGPLALAAQTTATSLTVDAGAAVLGQTDAPSVLAPTLGADWRRDAVRTTFRASAAATFADRERWAMQGVGAGSWFLGSAHAPRELGAAGSVVRLLGVPAATSLSVLARQHVSAGDYGAWVGSTVGVTARGALTRTTPALSLDGAVWRQSGTWRLTLGVSGLATHAYSPAGVDWRGDPVLRRGRYSALDVTGGAAWQRPRLELAADVGLRRSALRGEGGGLHYSTFALATAVVPLHPAVAFVATAGDQFADPVRGTPAVRHVSLALRLRPASWRAVAAARRRPLAADDHTSTSTGTGTGTGTDVAAGRPVAPAATLVVDDEGGERVVRVSAPAGALRVELRADATGWRSVPLAPRDGRWEARLRLAPGTHRVMLRVDDAEWAPPANLPAVDDDFGSRVGLLVLP
ncbi:MAG: glycogen-binding domain-containing protein [Gemmatimonadaceae bacterium]